MCKRIMAAQTNTECGVPFYKIGTIGGKADAYISKELFDEYKTKYPFPHRGEVMITCAGTVGKCIIYNGEESYYQDSNIVWIDNPKEIISNDFLFYLLSRINWSYLNSTTIVRIYNDDLRNLKLYYPKHDEQKKLTHFLFLINERISTQNKIIEDLKKLRSAISKYLFERKDLFENKIKLSKVAELKNGYAFQSSKYNALGKWKILTIANVAGERYVKTNECNCIIEIPYDIQKHQKLEANDILISLTGNVGRVSLCTEGFFLLNQRVGLLQLKISENREFIYQVLSFHKFEESMIACAQGAAQMNIGKGDVENYILPYSFNKENINSVASVLKNYDKYIINEKNMLSMLHSQKQYLLRQMFI